MLHYTDKSAYNSISAGTDWLFKASKPPGNHEVGAYFTTLNPNTPNLATRLRIPKSKLEYVFNFSGQQGLQPLDGGRGDFIFWSRKDYNVIKSRQLYDGLKDEMP